MRRRVVISGYGAISALGCGIEPFWNGLLEGRSGIAPIASFGARGWSNANAGEVRDFDATRDLSGDEARRLDRISQFAMVATREALTMAGIRLAGMDTSGIGASIATSVGGMLTLESYLSCKQNGQSFPYRELMNVPYYALAPRVARELNLRGPVASPSIACASGTQAVAQALDWIRGGHADVVIAGGAEVICPFVVSGFNCLRATTADTVRPFDAERSGLLLGEGAAILVIEAIEHARERGAEPLAEIAGAGLAGDATHMTAPARDGSGAARAMKFALADAGVSRDEVDFVNTHGTGTVFNDAMEIEALKLVFAERVSLLPVNGIKGAIGHTLGAAGAFEAILCAEVLRRGVIPPTVNCRVTAPDNPLDVVRDVPRRATVRVALSTSSAFAGNNAAIVLRAMQQERRAKAAQRGRVLPMKRSE